MRNALNAAISKHITGPCRQERLTRGKQSSLNAKAATTPGGIMANDTISVKVNTNSGKSKIERCPDGTYHAHVKAPREKGKANSELIKLIRKNFGKKAVIISGLKSRRKTVK